MLLEACLNGSRTRDDHARCPITPGEVAADGAAAVAAGAGALHVHPRDPDGAESLLDEDVSATLHALREVVKAPVGVTTGAWALPDPEERLRVIAGWSLVPDFASVNLHEEGAVEIAEMLLARGVGIEAGVWTPDAAALLVASGLAPRCLRVLVEPFDTTPEAALATVDAIETMLDAGAPDADRLLHGIGDTAWEMIAEAARRGHDTRVGLEDTLRLPDGVRAADNGELVRTALLHHRQALVEPSPAGVRESPA
jgi:uncharacterized protein (DUF849 family)